MKCVLRGCAGILLLNCSILLTIVSCGKRGTSPPEGEANHKSNSDHRTSVVNSGNLDEKKPTRIVRSLREVKSIPEVKAWHLETMKKGALGKDDASELRDCLKRIADENGNEISEVAGELLKDLGESGYGASIDVFKALKDEPTSCIRAIQIGLTGRTRDLAMIRCFSAYAQENNTKALAEIYESLNPGSLRSTLAEKLAKTSLVAGGLEESLNVVDGFEYIEERRQALMQVSRAIVENRGLISNDDSLNELYNRLEINEMNIDILRDQLSK